MYYRQSSRIFETVKKAKNLLINTHKNPDYDSLGSALAMQRILKQLEKEARIISCQQINPHFFFLPGASKIEKIDYKSFDFSTYDLFIIADTGSSDRVTGSKQISLPKNLNYIILDHHKTNDFSNWEKLLDENASATCELLFYLFKDWKMPIDKVSATYLLTGIMGDTVFLRHCQDNKKTFRTVSELVEKGADQDLIAENFFEKHDFKTIKLLGEFLAKMKKEVDFVWTAVPYALFEKYGKPEGVREMAADLFFRGIKGTEFGVAMLESKKGMINVSFRSKKYKDVVKLAEKFGGGGHKNAAGATLYGNFAEEVKKVLMTAKKNSKNP